MHRRQTRLPNRAREILRHYLENPHTADTVEGIAGWRLIEDIVQAHVRQVDEALDWLVEQGYLAKSAARRSSPPVYTLNGDRRADAEQLVAPAVRAHAGRRRR